MINRAYFINFERYNKEGLYLGDSWRVQNCKSLFPPNINIMLRGLLSDIELEFPNQDIKLLDIKGVK